MHAEKIPLADDVDLGVIARGTPGFSGADLANLVNEAALLAARTGQEDGDDGRTSRRPATRSDGAERKSLVISEKEKRNTAYHEAGHAIVTALLPEHTDPLHKVTIIPRGRRWASPAAARRRTSITYRKNETVDPARRR